MIKKKIQSLKKGFKEGTTKTSKEDDEKIVRLTLSNVKFTKTIDGFLVEN